MDEASKSRKIWGDLELRVLQGKGIDIGCGPDPVSPDCATFDVSDGDANRISEYIHDQYDFVFSSHCLEHMHDPKAALHDWWKLVKAGGYIFFLVPDEDLYEQGVFPSRFNNDHKATFTISKSKSWSPKSINVLDLALSLPNGKLVNIALQDHEYDRTLMTHGIQKPIAIHPLAIKFKRIIRRLPMMWRIYEHTKVIDQTAGSALAQIQCIVQKIA